MVQKLVVSIFGTEDIHGPFCRPIPWRRKENRSTPAEPVLILVVTKARSETENEEQSAYFHINTEDLVVLVTPTESKPK